MHSLAAVRRPMSGISVRYQVLSQHDEALMWPLTDMT
jgi:hypothetical protein